MYERINLKQSTFNLIQKIEKLQINSDEIETLEQCEAVTNLIIDEVMISLDKELIKDVKWLQEAHREPNRQRWLNLVELTENLFREAGGATKVKAYHELEQPCQEITKEDLEAIQDVQTREIIMKIKHIHEQTLQRMTGLIEKCYYK